jgi:hypothetical protein
MYNRRRSTGGELTGDGVSVHPRFYLKLTLLTQLTPSKAAMEFSLRSRNMARSSLNGGGWVEDLFGGRLEVFGLDSFKEYFFFVTSIARINPSD